MTLHGGADTMAAMAHLEYRDDDPTFARVAASYRRRRRVEGLANILRIHGHNPAVFEAHVALYEKLMFGPSPLRRRQREMLAVVVSAGNGCHY